MAETVSLVIARTSKVITLDGGCHGAERHLSRGATRNEICKSRIWWVPDLDDPDPRGQRRTGRPVPDCRRMIEQTTVGPSTEITR